MHPDLIEWAEAQVDNTLAEIFDLNGWIASAAASAAMQVVEAALAQDDEKRALQRELWAWGRYEKDGGERPADAPQGHWRSVAMDDGEEEADASGS